MLQPKILMTGATSFVGTHVLTQLVKDGYQIVALKRPSSVPTLINNLVEWVDLAEIDNNQSLLANVTAIIHIATDYGRKDSSLVAQQMCNVILPSKLLELMPKHGVKRFISTDSFFGKYEHQYGYMRSYMASKRHFAEISKIFAEENPSISIQNLRLEHVYGENDKVNKFIPFIVEKLKSGEEINCTIATQKRDFIYIKDVVSAYKHVLNSELEPGYKEFEVGTGETAELRTIIEIIKNKLESESQINYGAIALRDDEIMASVADISSLKKLGWIPKHSLAEGIESMLGYNVNE
ncbi:NAD-dependent epimerase/dehydratase [Cedecea neteri]|uniref:NAD-dependent epimerase/dehydratase family protein n=1 Tax=Cedecea neteri TaxID=158822 RepID=UPI0028934553|nr:NAD-dependent epimerase/dehydratase [Cedecea neteri]WNJ81163.1 NAD-dependent epimerase/dehydratase [Cedecea neteri]